MRHRASDAPLGDGWRRGDDGLLHKKYDPHAATRARQYEAQLRAHQARGAAAQSYASNDASTAAARGAVVRARAAATREAKVAKAREFNERHERAVAAHQRMQAQPRHSAALSHRENASYMRDFHEAFGLPAAEPPRTLAVRAPSSTTTLVATRSRDPASSCASSSSVSSTRWREGPTRPRGGLVDASDRPILCLAVSDDARDCVVGSADHACYGFDPTRLADDGPDTSAPARRLYSKTEGHAEWVTAVARVPPICCSRSSSSEVLSAGMDGKVVRWRGARRVAELRRQGPSVSTLLVDAAAPLALTCAYDGASTLWDLTGNGEAARFAIGAAPALCACWARGLAVVGDRDGTLAASYTIATQSPSRAPVRTTSPLIRAFARSKDDLKRSVTCDGDAGAIINGCGHPSRYDLARASDVAAWRAPSGGHVVAVAALSSSSSCGDKASSDSASCLFATGAQDGRLRIFDVRCADDPVAAVDAHRRRGRCGVVSCVRPLDGYDDRLVATAGADRAVRVIDLRRLGADTESSRAVVVDFTKRQPLEDVPQCLATLGPLVITGDAAGHVLCHDARRGDCAWGLGAQARGTSVRALDARPELLTVAGDDGNVLAWAFG